MDFEYVEHIQFGQKYLNYPLFSPVDPLIDQEDPLIQQKRKITCALFLLASYLIKTIRLHANPFVLDFDNNYQHTYSMLYGSTEVIPQIMDDITEYTYQPEDHVWTLSIKGRPGSGKSLFARCLLIEVIKHQGEILSTRYKQMV